MPHTPTPYLTLAGRIAAVSGYITGYLGALLYHATTLGLAGCAASACTALWASLVAWAGADVWRLFGVEPPAIAGMATTAVLAYAGFLMLRELEWTAKPRVGAVVEAIILGSIGFACFMADAATAGWVLMAIWA